MFASSPSPFPSPSPSPASAPNLSLTDSLTEFLIAHDYSPATSRWYREKLPAFFRWAAAQSPPVTTLDGLTAPLIRRYIDERKTQPSKLTGRPLDSFTLHGHVRALRAWLRWLAAEDLLDPRIPARIALPKKEQKVLRVLDKRQIVRLFLAADTGPTALRDHAVLAVLLDTGIRAAELCGLERSDVHITPEEGYLLIRHGKGRRQREVPLGKKARLALARYLRSHQSDAVFVGTNRGSGKGVPLTPSGVDQLLYALVDRAGRRHFEGLKLGAHLYRHTFAVNYLEAGGEIYALSRIMGHSEVSTTEGYLRSVTARQVRQRSLSPLDKLGA